MPVHPRPRLRAAAVLALGLTAVGCDSQPDAGTVDISKAKAAAAASGAPERGAAPDESLKPSRPAANAGTPARSYSRGN
jgi:hypothetical protein